MNKEFKRMMKLAGLTEIKIRKPNSNFEEYTDVKTLDELKKTLQSVFFKSNISIKGFEQEERGDELLFVDIDGIEIGEGAYQLWDVYDTNTDDEQSFMSTPDLLIWLKDRIHNKNKK
jgi:hypothetical protein